MAFLFWSAIQEAKNSGLEEFEMGRSDISNPGLISFKEHWAQSVRNSVLDISTQPGMTEETTEIECPSGRRFRWFPICAKGDGRLLYRHVG